MSSSSQNQFLTLSPEIRPATTTTTTQQFLSLAPAVSASHPRAQRNRADSDVTTTSSLSGGSSPTLAAATTTAVPVSNTRVLKLSPVHWGAHEEEHQGDYHDVPQSA